MRPVCSADHLGEPRGERAGRRDQGANEAVARKERRPLPVADRLRQERLLGWQEDTDVAGGWIEGANEGDDQERPEVVDKPAKPSPVAIINTEARRSSS